MHIKKHSMHEKNQNNLFAKENCWNDLIKRMIYMYIMFCISMIYFNEIFHYMLYPEESCPSTIGLFSRSVEGSNGSKISLHVVWCLIGSVLIEKPHCKHSKWKHRPKKTHYKYFQESAGKKKHIVSILNESACQNTTLIVSILNERAGKNKI